MCNYRYVRGKKAGTLCSTKPRNGDLYCAKHRPKADQVHRGSRYVGLSLATAKEENKVIPGQKCDICYDTKSNEHFIDMCSVQNCKKSNNICKDCFLSLHDVKCPFCRSKWTHSAETIYYRNYPERRPEQFQAQVQYNQFVQNSLRIQLILDDMYNEMYVNYLNSF